MSQLLPNQSVINILDRQVNLHKYKQPLLDSGFLTPEKLFLTPVESISFQTHVPIDVCQEIVRILSDSLVPQIQTISEPEFIPRFLDPIIDAAIKLPPTGIVELAGLAGSGKTNLMFQLAVNARVSFPERRVAYLSTEGRVPVQRLNEIALAAAGGDTAAATQILDGITISEADNVNQVSEFVDKDLPPLFTSETELPPSIVIIDSIAALFRLEYNEKSAPERTRILFGITTTLKWLSELGNTGIFITNQATANMGFGAALGPEWVPALGFSWSNCINVRLRVTKTQMKREYNPAGSLSSSSNSNSNSKKGMSNIPQMYPVRTLYIELSPILQDTRCEFLIDTNGVHGI